MKLFRFFIFLIPLTLFFSCGNSARKSPSERTTGYNGPINERINIENQWEDGIFNSPNNDDQIKLTGKIETCNKCMGHGMVQDGWYSEPHPCTFCFVSTMMRVRQGWTGFDGRYGQVDAVFNTLPSDYFDYLDWKAGNANLPSGSDKEQITSEIAMHEANIAQLEQMLGYIEGGINRIQIEQRIIEEQYEIKRLRQRLEY